MLKVALTITIMGSLLTDTMPENCYLYFGYGSNMWSERLKASAKNPIFYDVGYVKGQRLEFSFESKTWGGAAANIVPDEESTVYGVIWKVDATDEPALDMQEGVLNKIYRRITIPVTRKENGDVVECRAYILCDESRNDSIKRLGSENLKPSLRYKNVILRGARQNHLPDFYIKFLENIPDNGYNGPVNVPNLPEDS